MKRCRAAVILAITAACLLSTSVAFATVTIHPGKGVGSARIGMTYTTAAKKLSRTYKTVRDKNYSYVVFHTYVGKVMKNRRYPVELYAKKNKRVFRFQVNSPSYKTAAGVGVGSAEETLQTAHPDASGPYTSGVYRRYTIKHKIYSYTTYTDFYCKRGAVAMIIVRR
jgi:hypothetical protein